MKQTPHPTPNPNELNRKSLRCKNIDYTRSNIYYVSLCTQDRMCYFGDIEDGVMKYSNQGSIAEVLLHHLPQMKPMVRVINYVIMPDHIHAILDFTNEAADQQWYDTRNDTDTPPRPYVQKGSISTIIGNYKSAVTRDCHRQHLEMEWQTSFFDHVVENPTILQSLNHYIDNNPANWDIERLISPLSWPL